jgi:hypothetical protein
VYSRLRAIVFLTVLSSLQQFLSETATNKHQQKSIFGEIANIAKK